MLVMQAVVHHSVHRRGVFPGGAACVPVLCALVCALCVVVSTAHADNWQGRLHDTGLPMHVVAVDKARQLFFLYEEKDHPLALKYRYACTTGQVAGDKQVVNDRRTPEGIYFVDYKIASGLDFGEYGGIAYTLNYPNPVDKLRGKTGHGIWIHSKGFGIVPNDTRGCIAIGLKDIGEAGPLLKPGTPVLVAEHFPTEAVPARDDAVARQLKRRMEQWTRAWASRSARMFDFYDADAYTRAMPETFAAFRANKERLFKMFDWINIFNRKVHVLEGPGYWVTWSEQFYRAPNLSTEGIRRLYWQKDAKGQFRIVGMEWIPRDLGMRTAFLKGQLVASVEADTATTTTAETVSEAPVPPPISMPEAENGNGAAPGVVAAITPKPQPDLDVAQHAAATSAVESAPVAPAAPEAVTPEPAIPEKPVAPVASAPDKPAAPATPPLALDEATRTRLQQDAAAWFRLFEAQSPEIFDFYDKKSYGRVKGLPADTFKKMQSETNRWLRAPWLLGVQGEVGVSIQEPCYVTTARVWYQAPQLKAREGVQTLYWQPGAGGEMRIVASRWEPSEQFMRAAYLEKVSTPVTQVIEEWRRAWEAADLDGYMRHYTRDAHQQGRATLGIRAHKQLLWARNAPREVRLSGVRIQVDAGGGLRADMDQFYVNQAGSSDKGVKTLLLRPEKGEWRIYREEWANLAPAPAAPPAPQVTAARAGATGGR